MWVCIFQRLTHRNTRAAFLPPAPTAKRFVVIWEMDRLITTIIQFDSPFTMKLNHNSLGSRRAVSSPNVCLRCLKFLHFEFSQFNLTIEIFFPRKALSFPRTSRLRKKRYSCSVCFCSALPTVRTAPSVCIVSDNLSSPGDLGSCLDVSVAWQTPTVFM